MTLKGQLTEAANSIDKYTAKLAESDKRIKIDIDNDKQYREKIKSLEAEIESLKQSKAQKKIDLSGFEEDSEDEDDAVKLGGEKKNEE